MQNRARRMRGAVCALLLLCLTGCDRRQEADVEPAEEQRKALEEREWNSGVRAFDPGNYTKEMMMEDYDAYWDMLEQNCPLLQVIARQEGQTVKAMREQYRGKVEALEDGDAAGFAAVLNYVQAAKFHKIGHITLVSSTGYYRLMELPELANPAIYHMYDNEKAKAYYKWSMAQPEDQQFWTLVADEVDAVKKGDAAPEENQASLQAAGTEFIRKNIEVNVKDGVPIIAIRSFAYPIGTEEKVVETIRSFCLDNLGAEQIIIDIRNNTGGSDAAWQRGLQPLLEGRIWQERVVAALADTPVNRENWNGWPENEPDVHLLPLGSLGEYVDMGGVYKDDLQRADQLAVRTTLHDYTDRTDGSPRFEGHVWLLCNKQNYSSAESLVQFCQSSGFATVVGERTAGNGGEVGPMPYHFFQLPGSGMLVQYVPYYIFNRDGTCNQLQGTQPDIEVGPGEDALEACLRAAGGE